MQSESVLHLDENTADPRKSLYLRNIKGLRVDLDGRALRVRRPAKAVVWYPLARLARVICTGAVNWDCHSLLGCAEAGIPVVFLHWNGTVQCYLFGSSRSPSKHNLLYSRLRWRLSRPDGRRCYSAWREAMVCNAMHVIGMQMGQSVTELDAFRLRQKLAQIRRHYASAGLCVLIEDQLRGFLAGLSAELLSDVGLDAVRLPKLAADLDLVDDLVDLLGWALEWSVVEILRIRSNGGKAPDLSDAMQLTAFFESHVTDLQRLGYDLLYYLWQWLERN